MATSKTTTASANKKSTAGKTATKAKKATTAKKPAAKKATRKKSTDIVEVEVINEGTYMSDVTRKLAGNYDVEERERELAPMIRAKISGTLESRDQTKYTQMAAEVAAIGQEHVNAAVSGKTDILSRTADGAKIKTDGAEAMRRELAALAVTVNGLGKQSPIARWLPFLASPEKRLREFQARFQSAEESLQDTSDSVHNAALTMTRDADLLDTEAAYQRDRIQDIAADIHAVRIIRDDAEARVEELRATGDEGDAVLADALHSSVVDAADRRENELLGQVGTALYVCQELAIASQSARMLAGQAVQTLNNTIPVLKAQTLVRTALGTQEMVGDTLDAVNAAVAKLTDENTQLIGKNITGMVAREKSTIARVEDIKRNLDALTGFIVDARSQLSTLGEERRANSRELTEYVAPLVDKLEARREIDGGSVHVI